MKNFKKASFILTILSFLTLFTSANAEIKVVTSIKPIHSLASYLMDGVGKPDLIVDGYSSPHEVKNIHPLLNQVCQPHPLDN